MKTTTLAALFVLATTQTCPAITFNFDPPGQCCHLLSATDIEVDGVMYDFVVERIAVRDFPAAANHEIGYHVVNAINSERFPWPEGGDDSSSRWNWSTASPTSLQTVWWWGSNQMEFEDEDGNIHLRTFYLFGAEPYSHFDIMDDVVDTWGYGLPVDYTPLPPLPPFGRNLLINQDFNVPETMIRLPTDFGRWGGDVGYIWIAAAGNHGTGVIPESPGMLRLQGTSTTTNYEEPVIGHTSDSLQYVDLAPFAEYDGQLTALLTASFNRVAGDEETDTEFALVLAAHQGTPDTSPGQATSMAHEISYLITDDDIGTWEQLSVELSIPVGADFLQVTLAAIENVFDDTDWPELDGHFVDWASLIVYLRGDTDMNGTIDADDLDTLASMIRVGDYDRLMDLDRDGSLTLLDSHILVNDLLQTTYGDANLDGEFNTVDMIEVLASGTYEADVESNWSTGDWDGDGRTTSGDLVTALATGNYEAGQLAAVAAVPEPSNMLLLVIGMTACGLRGRRR